jgi:hypothetical protein
VKTAAYVAEQPRHDPVHSPTTTHDHIHVTVGGPTSRSFAKTNHVKDDRGRR